LARQRAVETARLDMMKTPVGLVTVTLAVAILLAASLLIVTGTRGEDGVHPLRIMIPAGR
jgi:hypothetical protein